MNKIVITIPLGACVKNLLLNPDFILTLKREFDEIHLFSPLNPKVIQEMTGDLLDSSIKIHHVPEKNNFFQVVSSQLSYACYNRLIRSNTFKIAVSDKTLPIILKIAVIISGIMGMVFSWKSLFNFFEKLKFIFSDDKDIDNLLIQIKPQIVFASAASFRYDYGVAYAANKLKVPVVGMVLSWDNLSSKGPLFPYLTKVFVWNDFQLNEVLNFTDYKIEQIKRVGIPQLDWYLQHKNTLDRENLARYLNVDSSCKIITYATGPHRMIPYESQIIEKIILNFRENFKKIDWVFLVRIHPKDNAQWYENLRKYKNIVIESLGSKGQTTVNDKMAFDMKDVKHYGEVIACSDIIFNIASTVFLEALIMGTPVVNILFDDKKRDYYSSVRRYYDFNHSKYLLSLGGSYVVRASNNLTEIISLALGENRQIKEGRREIARNVAYKLDGKSGERIGGFLIDSWRVAKNNCPPNES